MIQTQPQLGQFPNEDDRRDAIHIAIAPVVAGEDLQPGEHVGLSPDKKFVKTENSIGIVDPFLKETVKAGQTFWLCLYPYTITSLRHAWTHPTFKPTL